MTGRLLKVFNNLICDSLPNMRQIASGEREKMNIRSLFSCWKGVGVEGERLGGKRALYRGVFPLGSPRCF